jgi:hypothetical protein
MWLPGSKSHRPLGAPGRAEERAQGALQLLQSLMVFEESEDSTWQS